MEPHEWDQCLYKKRPQRAPSPSSMWRHSGKTTLCELEGEASADSESASTLILDFQKPEKNVSVYKCSRLWNFCYKNPHQASSEVFSVIKTKIGPLPPPSPELGEQGLPFPLLSWSYNPPAADGLACTGRWVATLTPSSGSSETRR